MIQAALSVFLITLGLGQLVSTWGGLRAASLVGPSRWLGYGLGALLVVGGALILPATWSVVWWSLPAGLMALALLLAGGSFIAPPPHPDRLFTPDHPAHAGCRPVQIPDGPYFMPGLLLTPRDEPEPGAGCGDVLAKTSSNPEAGKPPKQQDRPAVCIIPGAGDNKTSFKWRLVQSLLAAGLTVLTIDPPGHGEYRQRPLAYPDGLSAVTAAVNFLRGQPGVTGVGLIGISMGGALALRHLAENPAADSRPPARVEALVVVATPVRLKLNRALFYREVWNAYRAPVLSLLREISFRQIWQSWQTGGYRSQHNTGEWIALLNPLASIGRIHKNTPVLLVYSRRDRVAPPAAAWAMLQAAPQATLIESKKASHVTLILMPDINKQIAEWLRKQLMNE